MIPVPFLPCSCSALPTFMLIKPHFRSNRCNADFALILCKLRPGIVSPDYTRLHEHTGTKFNLFRARLFLGWPNGIDIFNSSTATSNCRSLSISTRHLPCKELTLVKISPGVMNAHMYRVLCSQDRHGTFFAHHKILSSPFSHFSFILIQHQDLDTPYYQTLQSIHNLRCLHP